MINIVTSICIDVDDSSKDVVYPNLNSHVDSLERRDIYWRCATCLCLTSIRLNKNAEHIIVTNDVSSVIINGYDLKAILKKHGVKIIEHSFDRFDPKDYSKRFRNAFYKFEAMQLMTKFTQPSILLDADCVWTKIDNELFNILISGNYLLLQDSYQWKLHPEKRNHGICGMDMAELYRTIPVNSFKSDNPIWYGGEIIGGSPEMFSIITSKIFETIFYCKAQTDKGNNIVFKDGTSIFENDEFISSYVYNSLDYFMIYDTHNIFSKRLWTTHTSYNVKDKDANLTIWHLPGEKETGFVNLFNDIIQDSSPFWSIKYELCSYLGKYFNVPK